MNKKVREVENINSINKITLQSLEQNFRWNETQVGLALEWGKSEIRGGNSKQPRIIHHFSIGMSWLYKQQYGGFGGSFVAGRLPHFLRNTGKRFEIKYPRPKGRGLTANLDQKIYRWFNRQRSAELPYMEIGFAP